MLKHRGFPGRLPSTDFQFTIRHANKKGATKLVARERYRDRLPADRRADAAFLAALIDHFGDQPFERGNLDAGRLSWLLGREVVAVGTLDPTSYDQLLKVDLKRAEASFPQLFDTDQLSDGVWDDPDDMGDGPTDDEPGRTGDGR
ncbi:hypothetical protein [uncultured Paracoccus sp.]|uniref:hypothetical protein n=1 Tax=uncultured Paracoccus sp. TaxID=189685 RepID=UPI00262FFD2D|nr:hypothetical protein [uncultured Paracoccus sp.]